MKQTSRKSIIVSIGRGYQSISPIFSFFDNIISVFVADKKVCSSVLCLLAPPRSGSTLSYQILTSSIKNSHLTNIWNLLYATPLMGGLLSKRITKGHISSFKSNHGYVPGLKGEAEGLKFWSYWTGQTLEQTSIWKKDKAKKLKKAIDTVSSNDEIFITGYLGHVFCIKELRKLFPKIVFVYLQRNLLSNARSIYNADPKNWFSTKPNMIENLDSLSRHQQIAKQLVGIHQEILNNVDNDFAIININKLGSKPTQVIREIEDVARSNKIELKYSKGYEYFKHNDFEIRIAKKEDDETNQLLYNALDEEINTLENIDLKNKLRLLLHD